MTAPFAEPRGTARGQTTIAMVATRRSIPVVGQVAPSATTNTTLYTVSVRYSAVGTIYVANRSATATTFRIAVRPAGATISNEHYIAYDEALAGNESLTVDVRQLDETDVVTVYVNDATVSFTFLGTEDPLR